MSLWMLASIPEDQAFKDKETTIAANRQARGLPGPSAPKSGPVLARRNLNNSFEAGTWKHCLRSAFDIRGPRYGAPYNTKAGASM
jgi:hypothetical protein